MTELLFTKSISTTKLFYSSASLILIFYVLTISWFVSDSMISAHSSEYFSESEWKYSQNTEEYQSAHVRQQDEYYKSSIMKSIIMKSEWSELKQNSFTEDLSWQFYKIF